MRRIKLATSRISRSSDLGRTTEVSSEIVVIQAVTFPSTPGSAAFAQESTDRAW
jgi:hypothetical protein